MTMERPLGAWDRRGRGQRGDQPAGPRDAGPPPRRFSSRGRTGVLASSSHPKHAELWLRNRGVVRRRQAECQSLTRFRRIEDAIVPQAGSGVVGRSFVLVLVQNRLAYCALLI